MKKNLTKWINQEKFYVSNWGGRKEKKLNNIIGIM